MNHRIKKRFGQHFLVDRSVIDRIVSAIFPQKTDDIVEIGPGMGALTEPLLKQLDRLTIIEIDRDLIAYWQKRYSEDRLTVIAQDVLDLDFSQWKTPFRLVGNLPYNISTPILMKLRDVGSSMIDAHFMLQKEVVDRIVAEPGSKIYGRLSIMVQTHFEVDQLFDVPPEAFNPPPKVDSSVVRLKRTDRYLPAIKDYSLFSDIVRDAFCQRRKTITNSLKKQITAEQLSVLGIDPQARAEVLSIENFIQIANAVYPAKIKDNDKK